MAPHAQSLPAQQQRYRVLRDDSFRQEASAQGKPLATVPAGVEVVGGAVKDGWAAVSLEGWIWRASLARTDRDGHNLIVTAAPGENLRTPPNRAVIARVLSGFLVDEMRRDPAWVRVRRAGWTLGGSLHPVRALVHGTPPPADSTPL